MAEREDVDPGAGDDPGGESPDGGSDRPGSPGERGTLSVADRVVEKVASIAAHEVDAVIAQTSGWRKLTGRPLPRAHATVAGGRARIGVEIATPWPTPLSGVATRTRDHVQERVSSLTGVDVIAVDVTISDVLHLPPESRKLR